jgi:Cu(I)/Ag(I) efflux system membrane protein CusA/SilA
MWDTLSRKRANLINIILSAGAIVVLLAQYWRPLGFDRSIGINLVFVGLLCFGTLGVFALLKIYYQRLLQWALDHKLLFLTIPSSILILGVLI